MKRLLVIVGLVLILVSGLASVTVADPCIPTSTNDCSGTNSTEPGPSS